MGGCCSCSKKNDGGSSYALALNMPEKCKSSVEPENRKPQEEIPVTKEAFFTLHWKSYGEEKGGAKKVEAAAQKEKSASTGDVLNGDGGGGGGPARTSSCTKEEVDAILIQCGRLSRSSSTAKTGGDSEETRSRKYSGSKRSYDFDNEARKSDGEEDAAAVAAERENRRRERNRDSQGRRRTPSREGAPKEQTPQKLSRSRERGATGGGGGRRVSRSPGRRSVSPVAFGGHPNSFASLPGKMVSVPATVSSETTTVMRIHVKRNAGCETPRTQSPARGKTGNENPPPPALNRSNSKKAAENSPFRRNPLSEIDTNIIISQAPQAKEQEQQQLISETLKPQLGIGQSNRSSRISIEEAQETKISSYTALLLEDIHNFHQKSAPATDFTLPSCLNKACSILEAVADLNSGSNVNIKCEIAAAAATEDDEGPMGARFGKYVTVERGTMGSNSVEESSGSNSMNGSQSQKQQWGCGSSWEPSSVESTDRWSSSSASRAEKTGLSEPASCSKAHEQNGGKVVVNNGVLVRGSFAAST